MRDCITEPESVQRPSWRLLPAHQSTIYDCRLGVCRETETFQTTRIIYHLRLIRHFWIVNAYALVSAFVCLDVVVSYLEETVCVGCCAFGVKCS